MWIGKETPQSNSYCFDVTPHFQYFNEYTKREQYLKDLEETGLTETMSIQGSCWMLSRDKYWELNICDENFGSWGSQGIEVAVKTWLSGGKVLVNHKTWYAHMFRTQGGDFSFPYPISTKDQEKAKEYARNLFFNNGWDKQIHPLSWLIEKFWPVKGWGEEDLKKLKENKFQFNNSQPQINTTETEPPANEISGSQQLKTPIYETAIPHERRGRPKKIFKNITIIGHGWVGKSVHNLFPDAYIYDPPQGGKQRANQGEVAFICVPTPSIGEGKLDTSIVEECVSWCQCPLIVIRSTLNPGTCDYLAQKYNKRIVMQPEYLGETAQHPLLEEKNTPFIVIGGAREDRRKLINLYAKVYNANIAIRQVSAYEAEVIKLTENRAIAFKVAQCQELYDVCEKADLDYYTIRDAVYGDDPRFNLWWTFVFPDKRGFKSKCIPKDVYAWCAWAESLGYNPKITRSILETNKTWILEESAGQNIMELITDNEIPDAEEDQNADLNQILSHNKIA
jgi:UDPglucose 6-dehydrogenase